MCLMTLAYNNLDRTKLEKMVFRPDGGEVGVQIDDGKPGLVTQEELSLKALSPFDSDSPPDDLKGIELALWKMTVGIIPEGESGDDKEKWVCVVAVYQESPIKKVYFIATQHCFGDKEDDNEFSNLPRVIKFSELQQQGELLGRFQCCTEEDIVWFMDYMVVNEGKLPATGVAFPSAEGYGLHGEKGGYDDKDRAIKIQKAD
jgi:hypothetical protein